ncbi:hypothetical protein GY45DRAFT_460734 [Cubamyces sp. BRFM 1775]|nr:hypothetical protein GY45DRAFT_460734 [Cubamyces sp. BRFM 1775]
MRARVRRRSPSSAFADVGGVSSSRIIRYSGAHGGDLRKRMVAYRKSPSRGALCSGRRVFLVRALHAVRLCRRPSASGQLTCTLFGTFAHLDFSPGFRERERQVRSWRAPSHSSIGLPFSHHPTCMLTNRHAMLSGMYPQRLHPVYIRTRVGVQPDASLMALSLSLIIAPALGNIEDRF